MQKNHKTQNTLGVIPARWASTRFPGKVLAPLDGKPMLQHVWERAQESQLGQVLIATDHEKVAEVATAFGATVVITSPEHPSGTDRVQEAFEKSKAEGIEFIVNIQGDEPFIQPEQLNEILSLLQEPGVEIATLAHPLRDAKEVQSPHCVKLARNKAGEALYFSRSPLPFVRDHEPEDWTSQHEFLRHVGLYAYRTDILREITQLYPSPLESAEKLEQLRWLEHGYRIRVGLTQYQNYGVDTPEDLVRLQKGLRGE